MGKEMKTLTVLDEEEIRLLLQSISFHRLMLKQGGFGLESLQLIAKLDLLSAKLWHMFEIKNKMGS